jgi:hypothetical protein
MSEPKLSEFARLTCASDHSTFTLRCDSLAWIDVPNKRDPLLLALSAAGSLSAVKAVRATLCQSSLKAAFTARRDDYRSLGLARHPNYKTSISTLAPGVAHLVAHATIPGFLADDSDAGLWRELTGTRYTTPLLESWLPWLRTRLDEEQLLVPSRGHNNNAVILAADTENLDEIVTEGVRGRALQLS